MALLIPLIVTTVVIRVSATWLLARGRDAARHWASWRSSMACGMAAVFLSTAVTHFVEPQRSGLISIVPGFVPWPELAVTLTGVAEIALAFGLVVPRMRRWAGIASVLLLLALFPANVVAAEGVAHPAAPSTALPQRIVLQLVFIGFSAAAIWNTDRTSKYSTPQLLRRHPS